MISYLKSYEELISLSTYDERLNYLKLYNCNIGVEDRYLSNNFYKSKRWLIVRKEIIARDLGYDLAVPGLTIQENSLVVVHHINPISLEDIINFSYKLFDPNNLITCSIETHNKIHYNSDGPFEYIERKPNDTLLW